MAGRCPAGSTSASTCPPRSCTRATRSCSTTRAATSAKPPGTRAISSSGCPAAGPGTSSMRARSVSPCESARWPTWSTPRERQEATCRPAEELPFALPESPKLVEPPFVAVRVHAAVTHTIGGLRIDERARVLDGDGRPVPGLHGGGRRRRRHLHRRLRQRPRRSARLRPHRRRDRSQLTALWDVSGPGPRMSRQDVLLYASCVKVSTAVWDVSGPGPHMSQQDVSL